MSHASTSEVVGGRVALLQRRLLHTQSNEIAGIQIGFGLELFWAGVDLSARRLMPHVVMSRFELGI